MSVLPSYRAQSIDLLANQLNGFYMRATLAFIRLVVKTKFGDNSLAENSFMWWGFWHYLNWQILVLTYNQNWLQLLRGLPAKVVNTTKKQHLFSMWIPNN